MDKRHSRLALRVWLAQAEEILRNSKEPDGRVWDEESVEHGDAA